jgi:hypothetical protein
MTTYNTGNPIGSTDARDRLDNSENLDLAVNSLSQTFVDRLGVTRDTLEGIYQKSAYYRAGTFDAGYTLTNNRQTLTYGNIEYSWAGTFPKVVSAGSTPATSGGIGAGAWVDRTDNRLRSDIEELGMTLKQLGWSFGEDIGPYITSAATQGVKKVILPRGVLYSSVISVTAAFSSMQFEGAGSGFAYQPATIIKPISSQNAIFNSAAGLSGCDNLKFKGICFDGDSVCARGINQLSGAAWRFDDVRTKNFTEWGLYSEQGLNGYGVIYGDGHYNSGASSALGCFALYSDFSGYHIEATGGDEPVKIMAGGGRIVNLWANSGKESCVSLIPLNTSTNHINTSITNLYAGETFDGAVDKPIIKIVGTAANKVCDVQIGTSHIVNAQTIPAHINHMIYAEYAQDLVINNIAALGYEFYQSSTCQTTAFLKAVNSNDIVLGSGVIRGISKNPVLLTSSSITIGDAVRFVNWGGANASADEKACIRATDSNSKVIVNSPTFINTLDNSATILRGISGVTWSIGSLSVEISNTVYATFDSNPPPYRVRVAGDSKSLKFGREVTYIGVFSSPAGGGSVLIKAMPNIAEDQCYEVTIQQEGSGANATSGKLFIGWSSSGVITEGNTNTIAELKNTFSSSGLNLNVTIGTGYGVTTWAYQLTRIM